MIVFHTFNIILKFQAAYEVCSLDILTFSVSCLAIKPMSKKHKITTTLDRETIMFTPVDVKSKIKSVNYKSKSFCQYKSGAKLI